MAQTALAFWGNAASPPRLVRVGENIVFEAHLRDGRHVALRLHRPGYQSLAAIEAELEWCAALAGAGVPVARPLRAINGEWTGHVGNRRASCVEWLAGAPIGAGHLPLAADAGKVRAEAAELGALIARLHGACDAGAVPADFPRKPWDAKALLGERPRWGAFWDNPALSTEGRDTLLAAREAARAQLVRARDFGPIHADLLRENVLRGPDGLALIDFDDSGPGWRLYDLGTALVSAWRDPMLPVLAGGLLAGYGAHRPLPPDQRALLPLFMALRAFASCGWVMSRCALDDPRLAAYAERAVDLARHVLEGTAPWEAMRA
jgi:Ser/Thr protein kinase RdoA (MazF antagonist)